LGFGHGGEFFYTPGEIQGESKLRNLFVPAIRLAMAAAFVMALTLSAPSARAADPDFLVFSVGAHDVNDDKTTSEFRLEYRSDINLSIFKPFTGFMFTADEATYAYAGIYVDFFIGRRFVVQPSFAAGAYRQGKGKNLGNTLEFRSQIEFAYRRDDRSRIGVSVNHISNASLAQNNPGTESIVLNYAMPLAQIVGKYIWND
jgi:hypothetical protein